MTRIATARIARSARVACDEFALECADCPFARLAEELVSASDAELFYWFDYDPVAESDAFLGWMADREEEGLVYVW